MLRLISLTLIVATSTAQAADAITQFPYEAVSMGDDVFVRSGPGQNYYATGKLQKNDRVTVHRHDPGGWFMIAPPSGSFSWIESSLVERTGDRGIVNVPADEAGQPGKAIVRIGSTLSDDHSLTGRQLANGDEVTIIGQRVLNTEAGAVQMLQIAPPPREYRWVKGNFIVPVDSTMRQQIDSDPYAVPSAHRTPEQFAALEAQGTPIDDIPAPRLKAPEIPKVVVQTAHVETEVPPQRLQLIDIDNEYADMMVLDIGAWRLDDLRNQYVELKRDASPALLRQIDVRLAALDARQKVYDRYARFAALAAETDRRDAELLSSLGGGSPADQGVPPQVELGAPGQLPELQGVAPQPLAAMPSQPQAAPSFPGQTPQVQLAPQVQQAGGTMQAAPQKMSGAGVIQATAAGTQGVPRHFLVAPDGRFLAYLQSSTVDLNQYVGQSLGLYGNRARDARFQADVIDVSNVAAVQLTR
jgi:hypothetical protein